MGGLKKYIHMNIIENNHPCYDMDAKDYMRIHLPIAPKCNIVCKYCVRKFDCQNESRPGVTSKVLTPYEAVELYLQKKRIFGEKLSVIGISGPGDPLANWENVEKTLSIIREKDKNVKFCLSTNGNNLEKYIDQIYNLKVDYVTVTINAFSAETAKSIYNSTNSDTNWYADFLKRQWAGVEALVEKNIRCKINTVLIKGVNEEDTIRIAKKAGSLGCEMQNIIPLIPLPETCFNESNVVKLSELLYIREKANNYIKQMTHCQKCRSDACGCLI